MEDKREMRVCRLLDDAQLGGNKLFACITMEPGWERSFHMHYGEAETYYIVSGTCEYNENGAMRVLNAGDTVYCGDGEGHGIRNIGDDELIFIALITPT